ncbi:MAG: potassium channel protein, partial [Myxococcales bacterium]|nr:potassium channel protein [Myxococcales bacterium]
GAVLLIGTAGFYVLPEETPEPLSALYMAVITLTTVGYGEVIDLNARPAGRVFTIVLLVFGVGSFLNFVSALTAFWVDGQATRMFWRRRMTRELAALEGHIIVCGAGHTGAWICRELLDTRRPFAVIERDPAHARDLTDALGAEVPLVLGDATDDDVLVAAGVARASSLVTCLSVDQENLVVALSARILTPHLRIISRCIDERMEPKIRKAGADRVISPNRIGGLRMVSEAVRPGAVDYLDRMLRDRDAGLRVESTVIGEGSGLAGRDVAHLKAAEPRIQLLAVRRGPDAWEDGPDGASVLRAGDQLVYTGGPEVRRAVEALARP